MSKNTVVRGCLVPSLKNKPLDGRQDVPTLADIANIENPYMNFIFPVEETGKWYKVVSLTDKVIDELVIPNGMIDEYEEFGGGMTDTQKQEYLTKQLAELTYLKKEDAEAEYLKKEDAEETYQPKGEYLTSEEAHEAYQPKGEYATTEQLEDLENRISQGGGGGEGGSFIDAPSDDKTYGRKNGLWEELKDAPSDGKAYARLNGKWVAIESGNALDPMLPVLSLNINSTKENDLTIDKVLAIVTYADKEFALGNGGQMNVPYGLDVTITFPNIEGYEKPENVVFSNVQSDIHSEVEYVYVVAVNNVYVSADDSSSVDGQIVTVEKSSTTSLVENGVYIEDVNGDIFKKEEWEGGKTANSVLVISDKIKARIGGEVTYSYQISTSSTPKYETKEEAFSDIDSSDNSLGASSFNWPNGTKGAYKASLGELKMLAPYWNEVMTLASMAGISIKTDYYSSTLRTETNSVQGVTYGRVYTYNMLSGEDATSPTSYLLIKKLTDEDVFNVFSRNHYEVLGGHVSFSSIKGDNIKVSISSKGDEYTLPSDVSFVSDGTPYNISFVYNKLIIDTIYINNLIADTDSIISGEMNGAAVQAIWDGVHRYLGKIVTKEDTTEELVLLDIDQNDNRYYIDGSMIDLEALGTTAYFFTKIPSMAYKITQMSDNIYKVQISYKHKPSVEGWKYFDELIVPTFSYANEGTNRRPLYYKDGSTNLGGSVVGAKGLSPIGIFEDARLVLLMLAKYGVTGFSNIEEIGIGNFMISGTNGTILNGYSLSSGGKDMKFKCTKTDGSYLYVYNFLGLESYLYGRLRAFVGGYIERPLVRYDGTAYYHSVVFNNDYSINIKTEDVEISTTLEGYNSTYNWYIKSLWICDYFTQIARVIGGTSQTYYRESRSFDSSNRYQGVSGLIGGGSYSSSKLTTDGLGRLKYSLGYRIEQDRDAFNALTNIWV